MPKTWLSQWVSNIILLFSQKISDVQRKDHCGNEKKEKSQFRAITRVESAIKRAAKMFNRIFSKAKMKLMELSSRGAAETLHLSTQYQTNDLSMSFQESKNVSFNEYLGFSTRTVSLENDAKYQNIPAFRTSNDSLSSRLDSELGPFLYGSNPLLNSSSNSCSNSQLTTKFGSIALDTTTQCLDQTSSITNSGTIYQVWAESITDLNKICAENKKTLHKSSGARTISCEKSACKIVMQKCSSIFDESEQSLQSIREDSREEDENFALIWLQWMN